MGKGRRNKEEGVIREVDGKGRKEEEGRRREKGRRKGEGKREERGKKG